MKRAFLLIALALVLGCKEKVTGPRSELPRPRFVAAAADTAAIEQGIDAVPEEDAIFLQWHRDAALAGFQLYRRREGESAFSLLLNVTARDSSYIDRVSPNIRCYYYLRGLDDEAHLSAPSDTTDYMLLAKAGALSVMPGDSLLFYWSVGIMQPVAYVLRLQEESSERPIWISLMEPSYQGTRESTRYNRDGRAKLPELQRGVKYRWRLDCVGAAPRSGSESAWQRFTLF